MIVNTSHIPWYNYAKYHLKNLSTPLSPHISRPWNVIIYNGNQSPQLSRFLKLHPPLHLSLRHLLPFFLVFSSQFLSITTLFILPVHQKIPPPIYSTIGHSRAPFGNPPQPSSQPSTHHLPSPHVVHCPIEPATYRCRCVYHCLPLPQTT